MGQKIKLQTIFISSPNIDRFYRAQTFFSHFSVSYNRNRYDTIVTIREKFNVDWSYA